MEQTFRDRAYKMLTIANPNNGDAFFQLIFNYDWSKKGVVALTKEKLYTVATSRVHAKRCVKPVFILLYNTTIICLFVTNINFLFHSSHM